MAGPKGLDYVRNTLHRRFGGRWATRELELVSDYLYHISAAPASGEYALNSLLTPVLYETSEGGKVTASIFAKQPLENDLMRFHAPLLLLFGDNDWLRYAEVEQTVARWKSAGVEARYVLVPKAGHHLYLDNPPYFHDSIAQWLTGISAGQQESDIRA